MALRTVLSFVAYQVDAGGGVPLVAKGAEGQVVLAAADGQPSGYVADVKSLRTGDTVVPHSNAHGIIDSFTVDAPDSCPGVWFMSGPVATFQKFMEGSRGEPGLPGPSAVENDQAVAAYLSTSGTATRGEAAALTTSLMSSPGSGLRDATITVVQEYAGDSALAGYLASEGTASRDVLDQVASQIARIGPENVFSGFMAGALTEKDAVQGDPAFNGGYMNTFYGAEVGSKNQRGWKNTGFGTWALRDNVDGYNNVAIGDCALERNIGGVGTAKPSNTDPGSRNVGIGSYALRYNRTGFGNVGIGRNAAHTNVSGSYNTAMGTNAYSGQYSNGVGDEKTASFNTMLGYNAGFFTNADKNTAVGNQALYSNTTGIENTVIGSEAGYGLQTGNYNVIAGARALRQNPGGGSNTALGTGSMGNATSGSRNTAVGTSSLATPTGGSSNVAVGYGAGSTTPAGNNYSTSLGAEAKANHNNSVALGYGTTTTREDQVAFGNRILNLGVVASAPAATPGAMSLWVETISGKSVLKVRFATGPILDLIKEP